MEKTVKVLKQRKFLEVREMALQEKGIAQKYSKMGNSHELFIPYENVTNKTELANVTSKKWLIATIFFSIALLVSFISRIVGTDVDTGAELIWGAFTIISFFMYWQSKKSYVIVRLSEENLIFFKNVPNTKTVEAFIDEMFETRKLYLRERYARIDTDFSVQENIGRFRWLKDNDIITQFEYDELKRTAEQFILNQERNIEKNYSTIIN